MKNIVIAPQTIAKSIAVALEAILKCIENSFAIAFKNERVTTIVVAIFERALTLKRVIKKRSKRNNTENKKSVNFIRSNREKSNIAI